GRGPVCREPAGRGLWGRGEAALAFLRWAAVGAAPGSARWAAAGPALRPLNGEPRSPTTRTTHVPSVAATSRDRDDPPLLNPRGRGRDAARPLPPYYLSCNRGGRPLQYSQEFFGSSSREADMDDF